MDQPEAMQEDGDNWNQEEMVDAAIGLIALVICRAVVLVQVHLPLTVTVTPIDHWYKDL